MAIHKKEAFLQKEQDLAAFAKAISHPARIAILKVLAQKNECICGEIVEILPLAQSTVSQHLKALKQAGLIDGAPWFVGPLRRTRSLTENITRCTPKKLRSR